MEERLRQRYHICAIPSSLHRGYLQFLLWSLQVSESPICWVWDTMQKMDEVDISDFLDEEAPGDSREPEFSQSASGFGPLEENDSLKTRIAGFYINKQLEDSILQHGLIPEHPSETTIGVGFIDIVDYSYISSWLSPKENQVFLNGLYSAFHHVLKKRGGYLNKISGDSLMFHFGGIIDPLTKDLSPEESNPLIARLLFLTCIEIQESCRLFNRADEDFIPTNADAVSRRSIGQAFSIIRNLRENLSLITGIDALFQVRIRIGAALGEVCIGNFGPEGARQWDVIGLPVIEARRMEASAPVDGVRITKALFEVLDRTGLVEQYLAHFKNQASGFYQIIKSEELFMIREVVLKDKRNVSFESCAVQANPDLPEDVWRSVEARLDMGESGIDAILDLIKYYRGNRLVTSAIEELFREREIPLRKAAIFRLLAPEHYRELLEQNNGSESAADKSAEETLSLYRLFLILGSYQDRVKRVEKPRVTDCSFIEYDSWLAGKLQGFTVDYKDAQRQSESVRYFNQVMLPSVFAYLEAALREYLAAHPGEIGITDCP